MFWVIAKAEERPRLFSHHLGTADVWLLLESDKEHLENK